MTLALKKLEEKYLGENQAAILINVLNNLKIRNKLEYLIINNAHFNNYLI